MAHCLLPGRSKDLKSKRVEKKLGKVLMAPSWSKSGLATRGSNGDPGFRIRRSIWQRFAQTLTPLLQKYFCNLQKYLYNLHKYLRNTRMICITLDSSWVSKTLQTSLELILCLINKKDIKVDDK